MTRLYQYPTVNPRSTVRGDLKVLGAAVASSPVPVVVFPEGTRTRSGDLGRFKRGGLRAILAERQWEVWIAAADGFWEFARLKDFIGRVQDVRGEMEVDGPHASPAPGATPHELETFISEMESRMAELLTELRRGTEA